MMEYNNTDKPSDSDAGLFSASDGSFVCSHAIDFPIPEGVRVIRGIDEKFQVNFFNHSAFQNISIFANSSGDFEPGLTLRNDSGSGNRPFGFSYPRPFVSSAEIPSPLIVNKHQKYLILNSKRKPLLNILRRRR